MCSNFARRFTVNKYQCFIEFAQKFKEAVDSFTAETKANVTELRYNVENTVKNAVSEAKEELTHSHHRSVLQPVYRANSYESIRVICQSAMGGLLYLKPSTWGALEEANTYLYVSHSNDPQDCTFCASKNDLLVLASDYFILRFEGGSEAKNLDNFLKGELQGISDIRIILRSKKNTKYDSIFKKIAAKDDRATMDNVLIGSENNEWL